jgi:hypothetical protein
MAAARLDKRKARFARYRADVIEKNKSPGT